MKKTGDLIYKKTVVLTEQEYLKALKMIKPGEKWTEFLKRKIFGIKK